MSEQEQPKDEPRNCGFQYATISSGWICDTKVVADETELTLIEAKALWEKHYPALARRIKNGDKGEMAIWINMSNNHSYGETLYHIATDAESDGVNIWETQRKYFPKKA